MDSPVVADASRLPPAGDLRVGATIAAFFVTTFALLVFYLYVGVSGLRAGLLWSLLAAVPLSAFAGLVTWGAHRGRVAAVAIFILWGTLLGVWGGTAAPWAVGRLRAEMRTIEVPADFQLKREYDYEMEFYRTWRAPGTEAELQAQMLQVLVGEGFTLTGPPDGKGYWDASRGRLRARILVLRPRASSSIEVTLALGT